MSHSNHTNTDIIVTWPKKVQLAEYMRALAVAQFERRLINFRVPSKPKLQPLDRAARCYRLYDGFVRGYTDIIDIREIEDGIVKVLLPAPPSDRWQRGFRGWRYYP